MSMNDTIADMLTRIRNSSLRRHEKVQYLNSKMNLNISKILLEEGFIQHFEQKDAHIEAVLKYYPSEDPVIRKIKRVSRPGLRIYRKFNELPPVMNGQGICILSTSSGVVSDNFCRANRVGGEVLCLVY